MTIAHVITALVAAALAVSAPDAWAAAKKKPSPKMHPVLRRAAVPAGAAKGPVQTAHRRYPYVGAISLDAATGRTLFEDHADSEAYPASVTKLMTMLLVMEDIKAGKYTTETRVTATDAVYKSEPSAVGIRAGQSMTVRDLLLALMVTSANDAAIALGVHSAGSLDAFVARMNARAAELGMKGTRYYNPNGLPPKPRNATTAFNVTTCRDQAKLACVLVRMPEVFEYTSVKIGQVTDGDGKPLRFVNHNNLLVKNKHKIINPDGSEAVDGLKTGYIDAGGSSIVLTGKRGTRRAIVVVLGSTSAADRDEQAGRLLADALGALSW